ncbi:hypothetical protein TNCV_4733091 [Trichonephila clavipes]|nr:hypothetical protein TNCV_4733091 [Trichonephila clavipes]
MKKLKKSGVPTNHGDEDTTRRTSLSQEKQRKELQPLQPRSNKIRQQEYQTKRKNRWNAGILTITQDRSVTNSRACGPVCGSQDSGRGFSNNGRCYSTITSIQVEQELIHPRQDRYLVINVRGTSEGTVLPEHWIRQRSQSPQEYEFRDKLFTGDSIHALALRMPEDQQFAFPSRLRINAARLNMEFEASTLECGRVGQR